MSAFAISMGFLPNTNKQHTTENDQDDQGEDQTTHEEEHCNGGITMVHDGMFVVFRWNRCYEKEVRESLFSEHLLRRRRKAVGQYSDQNPAESKR
jgi:hypothetical protein